MLWYTVPALRFRDGHSLAFCKTLMAITLAVNTSRTALGECQSSVCAYTERGLPWAPARMSCGQVAQLSEVHAPGVSPYAQARAERCYLRTFAPPILSRARHVKRES